MLAGLCAHAILVSGITFADPAPSAESETRRFVPEWNVTLVTTTAGPAASDNLRESIQVFSVEGHTLAQIRGLVGPVHLAIPNRQILVCGNDGIDTDGEARVFGLDGEVQVRRAHLGFVRDCGVTSDGRLYWLRYDLVESGSPYSVALVFGPRGEDVLRRRFDRAETIRFEAGGKPYALEFSAPDSPG